MGIVTIEDKINISNKYFALQKVLDERTHRLCAATEERDIGFGGVSLVSNQTSLSRSTIHRGFDELKQIEADRYLDIAQLDRIRKPGAGHKSVIEIYPGITNTLHWSR